MNVNTAVELSRYFEYVRIEKRVFHWQQWNCMSFVCRWLYQQTGTDYMPQTTAATQREVWRFIRETSGEFHALITDAFGVRPLLSQFLALTGDPVLVKIGTAEAVGICTGSAVVCLVEDGTLCSVDLSNATHAWGVVR